MCLYLSVAASLSRVLPSPASDYFGFPRASRCEQDDDKDDKSH